MFNLQEENSIRLVAYVGDMTLEISRRFMCTHLGKPYGAALKTS
ncbi:hypothetical protein ADIAL_1534 [Alkalibacterium sp. AK22]|nr:hypothetical protein ADIAL_1534 [Alkalibacterium sp. AK22]